MSSQLNKSTWLDADPDFDFEFKVPSASFSSGRTRRVKPAPVTNSSSKISKKFVLWSEKHKPDRVEDLVVQKKKVGELKVWLAESLNQRLKGPSILILSGPSGCGKTRTLQLVCEELSVNISQWEEPVRYNSAVEWEYTNGLDSERDQLRDLNPLNHFRDFLFKASRYGSLSFGSSETSQSSLKENKVVVVKEIPDMAKNHLQDWYSILRRYRRNGTSPLVFITTEDTGQSAGTRLFFPPALTDELSIGFLSFNALAATFMTKALQRVLTLERKCLPDDCSLAAVVESSGGDLRSALNTLQLILMPQTSATLRVPAVKRRKNREASGGTSPNCKDAALNLMHALGKILYRKRVENHETSQQLPSHLSHESRPPLQENPDVLAEKMREPGSKVSLFLHQNYLHFYSRIEDVSRASDYLSLSDCLSREYLEDYALLVSVRGVMHCNTDVIGGKWRPLNKPAWNAAFQDQKNYQVNCRRFWPMITNQVTEFQTSYLPYLSRMSKKLDVRQERRQFLSTVGTFGKWRQQDHLNELLVDDDDDPVSLSIAVPPAVDIATPGPTLADVDEEEFVIEDYDD